MEKKAEGAGPVEEPKRPCWPSRLLVLAAIIVALASILSDFLA